MQKVEEFGISSSIHGIKYVLVLNNSKPTRIFWLISIFLSICGFFYYVNSAYYKLRFEPETSMKASDRNAMDFPAPAITICSSLFAKDGLANLTLALSQHVKKTKTNFTESQCKFLEANLHWCDPGNALSITRDCNDRYNLTGINVVDWMRRSAHGVKESFYMCDSKSCASSFTRVLTDFGFCLTRNALSFNSIFNKKAIHDDFTCYRKFGDKRVELTSNWTIENGYDAEFADFPRRALKGLYFHVFPKTLNANMNNMCGSSSFKIYLHKPNEMVTPSHMIEYLDLGEGMEIKLSIKSHKTDRALQVFPPEKRKCYFEGEKKLIFFKTYTKALCEWECLSLTSMKKCGCVKFSYPRNNSMPVCDILRLNCTLKIKPNCKCYKSCIDIEYSYKLLKAQYSSAAADDNSTNSFLEINFDSETVVEIENVVSYKLQNFIADLGGLLGLFMGCSLLSIMEIFYFIALGSTSMYSKFRVQQSPQVWATKSKVNEPQLKSINDGDILTTLNEHTKMFMENQKELKEIRGMFGEVFQKIGILEGKISKII